MAAGVGVFGPERRNAFEYFHVPFTLHVPVPEPAGAVVVFDEDFELRVHYDFSLGLSTYP